MRERPSEFFVQWGRFVLKHRISLLICTLATVVLCGWAAAKKLRIDMSPDAFASSESKTRENLQEYRNTFGRDEVLVALVGCDVFSMTCIERLTKFHTALETLDVDLPSIAIRAEQAASKQPAAHKTSFDDGFGGNDEWGDDDGWGDEDAGGVFEDVLSLVNAADTRSTSDGIEVVSLLDPIPQAHELKRLRKRVLSDPNFVGQLVNEEGSHTLVIMRGPAMSQEDAINLTEVVRTLSKNHREPGFEIQVAGLPVLNADLTTMSISNTERLIGLSFSLMILALGFLFRHAVGIIPPVLVVLFAAVNTFGFMAAVDMPYTLLTVILPSFLVCVGLGDSIHLLSIYRDLKTEIDDPREALIEAVGTTGAPIMFTTLTTVVGLLSFYLASIQGIREMGLAGALGVSAAGLHSLVLLPIALSFFPKARLGRRQTGKADGLNRFLNICNSASGLLEDTGFGFEPREGARRRRRLLALGTALLISLAFSISLLRVYHNPMTWLDDDQPMKAAYDAMDSQMGGSADVHLLIDGEPPLGLKNRDIIVGMEKLESYIRAFQHPQFGKIVGSAIGVHTVVKSTNRALHSDQPDAYAVPDAQRGVSDALFLFENAGPDELSRLATNDLGRGLLSFRVKWLNANGYKPMADYIEAGVEKFMPVEATVRVTGTTYTLLDTIGTLILDLVRSFAFAFVIITGLLMIQLRSIKMGLIAMVPNLAPIVFVLGFMSLINIPIDMITILIGSVAIGIAVDDTIHFLHHFRTHHSQYGNVEAAVANAMTHCGRAMVATTTVLCLGFSAYVFGTMDNIQRFGMLIALTAFVAMLVDLIFTPALLRTFYARPNEMKSEPS